MGSNFIWSEGAGEGREDNDGVSNQVGGLIIPGSGFITSLLQLGNFPVLSSCVFNSIIGWHSHFYCWLLKCAVNSTSEAKCHPLLLSSHLALPYPFHIQFQEGLFSSQSLLHLLSPLKPLSAFTVPAVGKSLAPFVNEGSTNQNCFMDANWVILKGGWTLADPPTPRRIFVMLLLV